LSERESEREKERSLTYVKTAMKAGRHLWLDRAPLMMIRAEATGGSHGAHIREPIYRLKDLKTRQMYYDCHMA